MDISVAEKLRLIMKRQSMTMGELAEASGQTRQNLSNKMTRGNFTEKDIESLASALGCSVKISPCHLPRPVIVKRHAVRAQLPLRRRIDRVSNLLPADRCRIDLNCRRQSRFPYRRLHNKLRHRAAADVAVANE